MEKVNCAIPYISVVHRDVAGAKNRDVLRETLIDLKIIPESGKIFLR